MLLSRSNTFVIGIAVAFLLPAAIPNVGLDFQYFFITVIVLFAWFIIKWDAVKGIAQKGTKPEAAAGLALIAADYAFNALRGSTVGIVDLIVVFVGVILVFYGVRSLRLFWVPLTYGVVLLVGYQIEIYTPNYVGLQDWLAGVMAASVGALGISAVASGHIVSMNTANGTPLLLDVAGSCTGLQGILAFGLLSTMTLLDLKPEISRVVPLFAVGFAGVFLINILRLLVVFLTFEFFGADAGTTMHVYFGYLIFVAWVLVFWTLAFNYLGPAKSSKTVQLAPGTSLQPVTPPAKNA
jgi:exosortase